MRIKLPLRSNEVLENNFNIAYAENETVGVLCQLSLNNNF